MAKKETWLCDRCGIEIPERPAGMYAYWYPQRWWELCKACEKALNEWLRPRG